MAASLRGVPPDRLSSASPAPPFGHPSRDRRRSGRHRGGGHRVASVSAVAGQAAVELVALLPLIALLLALAYQALLAGQAAWAAHVAARAAARANAVGAGAAAAARAHLPAGLERGLRVHASSDGDVRVSVEVPRVLPALSVGHVAATAHFRPQDA